MQGTRSGTSYKRPEPIVGEGSLCGPIPGMTNHNFSVAVSTNTAVTQINNEDRTEDFLPPEGTGESSASVRKLEDWTKDELLHLLLTAQKKGASVREEVPVKIMVQHGDMISAVSSAASCESRIPENELMEMFYCSKQQEMEGEEMWRVIRAYLVEKIFPYVKRFGDEDSEYEQPNFLTGIKEGDKEESRIICERLLTHLGREKKDNDDYTMKDKVFFWKCYRKRIKQEMTMYNSRVNGGVKIAYIKGK